MVSLKHDKCNATIMIVVVGAVVAVAMYGRVSEWEMEKEKNPEIETQ